MQLYRPMLKIAWQVTWRNKFLWFFGLFAALIGNGGAFNLGIKNLNRVEEGGTWLSNMKEIMHSWTLRFNPVGLKEAVVAFDALAVTLIIIVIAIVILLIWLAVSSQGALVTGISGVLRSRPGKFGEVFHKGTSKFWPVLLLNVVFSVGITAILVLLSLPFFILYVNSRESYIWQTMILILSFIVYVPMAVIFSLVINYALIYVMTEGKHIADALKEAWKLFAKNWLISVEAGLVLFLVNVLTSLLLVVVVVFVALPFVLLGLIASALASNGFFWLVVVLGLLTFIAMLFLYGAMWNVFQMTSWMLLFEKLVAGTAESKIARWAAALAAKKVEN